MRRCDFTRSSLATIDGVRLAKGEPVGTAGSRHIRI